MKKLMKGVAVSVAALTALAMVSCGSKKSAAVDIELWYGAAASEAGPIPADWVGYQIVKDKLNINLKLTNLPSSEADQNTKINAAGAANTLPDIFMVSNEVYSTLVSKRLLAPVDAMYAKMPNRTAKLYDADSRAFTTIDGHSYALAQPGSIVRNEGVLIRKDWLDKLGLSVPKTTDEFMAVMKAFTEKDPDGNGKNDTYGYGAFLEVSAPNEGLGRRLLGQEPEEERIAHLIQFLEDRGDIRRLHGHQDVFERLVLLAVKKAADRLLNGNIVYSHRVPPFGSRPDSEARQADRSTEKRLSIRERHAGGFPVKTSVC